jgi:hypothetical protein
MRAASSHQWAEFGFAMSIDYRLVGGSPAPAPQLDCSARSAGCMRMRRDADRSGARYLIGQSAGGQMVSLVATAGEAGFPRVGGWEKRAPTLRAVINIAATYELNSLSWGNLWTPIDGKVEELVATRRQLHTSTRP